MHTPIYNSMGAVFSLILTRLGLWHISSGESGYLAPQASGYFASGGSGNNANHIYTVSGGQIVYVQVSPTYSAGYTVNDTLTLNTGGGTGATVQVGSVLDVGTFTNNTLKAGDCNSLNSATGVVNGVQSFAPPHTPSATPPTDPIGSYFQTLPYGYQSPIPTVLNTSPTPQSSGWEQGFLNAEVNQQKGNWDENLSAHSVLNWIRPQFGMDNPP